MKKVTFKNNTKVSHLLVKATMISLKRIWDGEVEVAKGIAGLIAITDLYKKAQDLSHVLAPKS